MAHCAAGAQKHNNITNHLIGVMDDETEEYLRNREGVNWFRVNIPIPEVQKKSHPANRWAGLGGWLWGRGVVQCSSARSQRTCMQPRQVGLTRSPAHLHVPALCSAA